MPAEAALKARIRAELPPEAFAPKPAWALLVIPLVATIVALSWYLTKAPPAWYLALPCSVVLGLLYGSLTFLGHEIAHGVSIRRGSLQELVVYLSFAIYCISPHLWRVWHHQAHHAHTNMEGHDPDNFGTLKEFERDGRWCRFLYRHARRLGHGSCLALIFLCFFFALQGQGMLWTKSTRLPDFRGLRRRRAIADSLALLSFWAGLSLLAGPAGAVLVVLIPMFVANLVVTSYIVTTHMLCPLVERPDTLSTTMSVTTPRVVDILQFHFSHHVEHHLFPGMCSRYYPLVRQILRRHAGPRYLAPAHWRALRAIIATPRIYDGRDALIDPFSGRRIELERVLATLRRASPAES